MNKSESQDLERVINDLEVQIDRLRALYEQYFLGIEKTEPHVPKKAVERLLQRLRRERLRNTAQRFRFNQLVQRYNTMQIYWRRVTRQIEEGTYRRDVMRARARKDDKGRAQRSSKLPEKKKKKEELPSHEIDLNEFSDPSQELPIDNGPPIVDTPPQPTIDDGPPQVPQPTMPNQHPPHLNNGPPPPPPNFTQPNSQDQTQSSVAELFNDPRLGRPQNSPQKPTSPPPRNKQYVPPARPVARPQEPGALPTTRVKEIYREYLSARQQCNQSTVGLTLDKVSNQIRSQENLLKKRHGKNVDFQVSVKNGKAILRAVKRDES